MDFKFIGGKYKSLELGLTWNSIPKFAVLTGVNGSGKTQLLEYINNNIQNEHIFGGKKYSSNEINFVRSNWEPSINKKVQDIDKEITNINNSFYRYCLQQKENRNPGNKFYEDGINQIESILGKPFKELSNEDIYNNIPSDLNNNLKEMDDFKKYFISYEKTYQERLTKAFRGEDEDELKLIKNIKSPWDIINELFENYDFEYRLEEPNLKLNDSMIYFKSINKDIRIPITELSSGEKMIVSIIMWSHNVNTGNKIKIILLDEPDSFLHPSMSKMLIEIITNILVKEFNIQVIMTTHSLSTLAAVDEESIFIMNKEAPRIIKESKIKAMKHLASGVMMFNQGIELIDSIMDDEIILFTEGESDKIHLEESIKKLDINELRNLKIIPCDSSGELRQFLIGIPKKLREYKKIIGLFDFDEAGVKENDFISSKETIKDNCVFKKDSSLFTMLVPEIEELYGMKKTEIEFLYNKELLISKGVIKELTLEQFNSNIKSLDTSKQTILKSNFEQKNSLIYYKLKDSKKMNFANSCKDFSTTDFEGFRKLLENIIFIKNYNN